MARILIGDRMKEKRGRGFRLSSGRTTTEDGRPPSLLSSQCPFSISASFARVAKKSSWRVISSNVFSYLDNTKYCKEKNVSDFFPHYILGVYFFINRKFTAMYKSGIQFSKICYNFGLYFKLFINKKLMPDENVLVKCFKFCHISEI